MQKLLPFLIILLISCSSNKRPSLTGKWIPVKVSYGNSIDKKYITVYHRNNNEVIKSLRFKDYISQENEDSEIITLDTFKFRVELNTEYLNFDAAQLTLNVDSTFDVVSFGLIVPVSIPGFHFGDKFFGKWKNKGDSSLRLAIGDDINYYPLFYKIIRHTSDTLIINQTREDGSEVFQEIEFTRK